MAVEAISRCGFCHRPFDALKEKLVKVTSCGHEFHQGCFLNENGSHIKTTKKYKEIICPQEGCKEKVLKAEKAEFPNKIFEKIEIRNNPGLEAKRKDLALFKITAYAIVAFCVTVIAVAISPTWLGFALGLGLSVPGVWLTGKLLDKGVKKII